MVSGTSPRHDLVDALRSSPLFGSLGEPKLQELRSELSLLRLKGGATLFHAGDPGDALYVVAFGRLRAFHADSAGRLSVLGEIGRGESVGEMAVLTGETRSATVRAIRDTELVRLGKAEFEAITARDPKLMLEFTRLIVTRYQQSMGQRPALRPAAISVLPISEGIDVEDFVRGLAGALTEPGRTLCVDPGALSEMGAPTLDDADRGQPGGRLAGWLNEQEQEHDFLVYRAEGESSPWTRFCLRQADTTLLLVHGGDEAGIRAGMKEVLEGEQGTVGPRLELVLLYDKGQGPPRGTDRWLDAVPVEAHHHLDPSDPSDFARLARMLRGEANGLALGGGGARGLAHIGVLQALDEAGIPVDLLGGTSIGAILGAQYASGWEVDRIKEESRRGFVENGSLSDYTFPMVSILKGHRYLRMLRGFYGERRIEDLPLTYFCMSTNLTRSRSEVHRRGLVRKWVAASMAVPGVGPPIFYQRDILVDGGVTNNLPIDVVRGYRRGPVMAVTVSPRIEMRLDREYPDALTPWGIFSSRLNPFRERIRVPGIASILLRTVSLPQLSEGSSKRDLADLLFEPPVGDFALLDWGSFDELVEIGYRSAVDQLEQQDRISDQELA